jgi:hypothetical protein
MVTSKRTYRLVDQLESFEYTLYSVLNSICYIPSKSYIVIRAKSLDYRHCIPVH